MPSGSAYTYVGNADPKNNTGAIYTSQGIVTLGGWGYFLPNEYQNAESQGLLLVPGQSGTAPGPSYVANATLGTDGTVGGPGGSPLNTAVVTSTWQSASQVPGAIQNLVGGRAVLGGLRSLAGGGSLGGGPNGTYRGKYQIASSGADIRLFYDTNFAKDGLTMANPVLIKASIEYSSLIGAIRTLMSTGSPTTQLLINGLPDNALPSTTAVTVTDPTGTYSQTFTLNGPSTPNGTTLTVNSLTPTYAFPVGSVVTALVNMPVSFGSSGLTGTLNPQGTLTSEACPIEVTKGQSIYVRTYQSVPFTSGSGYLTITGGPYSIGVQQIQTTTPPTGQLPQSVTLDQGAQAETVTVTSYSGTSNPYTLNLAAVTTKTHANGTVIGQQGLLNVSLFADQGEASVNSDYTASGTYTAGQGLSLGTTTLYTPGITAGASSFQTNAPVAGTTLSVDTGGANPETVTVLNWQGTSAPYTCYISGTFAYNHSTGATVTAGVANSSGFGPAFIVADRLTGTRNKSVLIVGDSIPDGTGDNERGISATSYIKDAFNSLNIPYLSVTQAGETVSQFISDWGSQNRRRRLNLCDWAYTEYATNDIWNSATLAQVQANSMILWTSLKQRGIKVCAQTIIPRATSSSDNYATTTGQTISTAFNAVRIQYNDWIRSWQTNGLAGTYFDAYFDMANVLEVNAAGVLTQDGGYWATSGMTLQGLSAPGGFTADGIHPSWLGHRVMAAALATAAPTLFV